MPFSMVKKWSFLGMLAAMLLLNDHAVAQNFELVISIPVEAKSITTDQLKNVYVINSNGSLDKYDGDGHLLFSFNDRNFGSPQFVDASKAFKTLVYYPDHQLIKLLDKTLSEIGSINLSQLGMQNVHAVCAASDANIWVYDEVNFRLKKFDDEMKIATQSEQLDLVLGESIHPNFMVENEGTVYVNDSSKGIYVFDKYATYIKTIPIKHLMSFELVDDQLIYFSLSQVHVFNLKTLQTQNITIPVNVQVIDAQLQNARLYLLFSNQLSLYSFSK